MLSPAARETVAEKTPVVVLRVAALEVAPPSIVTVESPPATALKEVPVMLIVLEEVSVEVKASMVATGVPVSTEIVIGEEKSP